MYEAPTIKDQLCLAVLRVRGVEKIHSLKNSVNERELEINELSI